MLDQEYDLELGDEWLTANERLTRLSKAIEKNLGRVKVLYLPSIQGTQSSEEDLVIRERFTSRTERPSVREPGTNGNHTPIGKAQNGGSSDNSQEIPVSMENVCPKDTEDQSIISPGG